MRRERGFSVLRQSIELIGKLLIDFVRLECRLAVEDQMQGVGEGPARRDVLGKKL